MKKLVAFDLDDTLAVTKKPISQRMAKLLAELADGYDVCVITGGLYKQVEECVIDRLATTPRRLAHMHFMPVNGAQYHHYDAEGGKWCHEQFVEDLSVADKARIMRVVEQTAKDLGYWIEDPAGPIIADRGTQITYSALGQYAAPEDKYNWDPDRRKRTAMYKAVSVALPDFEVRINGNTSLDVMRPGIDKAFGLKQLCAKLGVKRDDVLFVGDSLQEGGNDYPVKAAGIDTIAVENPGETELIIEGLIAQRQQAQHPLHPWGNTPLPKDLAAIVAQLVSLRPKSRGDMKRQVGDILQAHKPHVLDTHNTASILFRFTADAKEYGLKIEFGAAEVLRNEAHWYELMPVDLKPHHVLSHISDSYAFVLLKWLEQARPLDDLAVAGDPATMDLVIQALDQGRELFGSNPTIPLDTSRGSSFFFDKYHAYNAGARKHAYLQTLLDSNSVRVNGRQLAGPYVYVQRVQQDDKLRKYLSPDRAGLIHGDSHAGNLLVERGRVYLIDPKGTDNLPLEYDTGRIYWSLTGWNAIVRGDFTLRQEGGGYRLDVAVPQRYVEGLPRFRSYFSEQDYHRAVYSAAMQYLTRVSHAAKQDETIALYLRGLQLFDDLFEELGIGV